MRSLNARYEHAVASIDAANAADPTSVVVRGSAAPLALVHGRLAAEWIDRLDPDAPEELRLAARAHHLRRWEVPRSSAPDGRAGYLRWRREQKERHARDVESLLAAAGYERSSIERVQALIRREGLGSDPGAQAVEDAACLVFLETQLGEVADRLDRDHVVEVLRRTARKMSGAALGLVAEIPLGPHERALLADALG